MERSTIYGVGDSGGMFHGILLPGCTASHYRVPTLAHMQQLFASCLPFGLQGALFVPSYRPKAHELFLRGEGEGAIKAHLALAGGEEEGFMCTPSTALLRFRASVDGMCLVVLDQGAEPFMDYLSATGRTFYDLPRAGGDSPRPGNP